MQVEWLQDKVIDVNEKILEMKAEGKSKSVKKLQALLKDLKREYTLL
jgi:hypothetical protein